MCTSNPVLLALQVVVELQHVRVRVGVHRLAVQVVAVVALLEEDGGHVGNGKQVDKLPDPILDEAVPEGPAHEALAGGDGDDNKRRERKAEQEVRRHAFLALLLRYERRVALPLQPTQDEEQQQQRELHRDGPLPLQLDPLVGDKDGAPRRDGHHVGLLVGFGALVGAGARLLPIDEEDVVL
eukprot:5869296-Prymnesium_polylepis.1